MKKHWGIRVLKCFDPGKRAVLHNVGRDDSLRPPRGVLPQTPYKPPTRSANAT
jgi:hypothetical protein